MIGRRMALILGRSDSSSYWPLSLAFCSASAPAALPAPAQAAVREAAGVTEARQFRAITTRLAENVARMQAAGVQMEDGSASLRGRLREAAAPAVAAWQAKAGEAGTRVLAAYRRV